MISPIIVYEHGDMMIFESAVLAENYIEAVDVGNNEYIVYDSQGTLLNIGIDSQTSQVIITDNATNIKQPEQLQEILIDYLNIMKVDTYWIQNATLYDLVAQALHLYK